MTIRGSIAAAILIAMAMALPGSGHAQNSSTQASGDPATGEMMMGGWHAYQRNDCATALRLLESAAATSTAELWSRKANEFLGWLHDQGRCVARDQSKALAYYARGAEGGDALANFNYGIVAYRLRDFASALVGFRVAGQGGHPRAQALLGNMYHFGHGVVPDHAAALEWYRKAAEKHDALGQFGVGYAYNNGLGVPVNRPEALRWFRLSADQGYAIAQTNLGLLLVQGQGVPVNQAEATQWFRLASEQQVPVAMNSYGYSLDQGYGVEKDPAQALEWYRRAAQFGQANAMHSIAAHYFRGGVVKTDLVEALYWAMLARRFYPATEPKREPLLRFLSALEANISPQGRESARQRSEAFVASTPPSPDTPDAPPFSPYGSIRERMRVDAKFQLYAAYFAVALDQEGKVTAFERVRVVDPAAGTGEPVAIDLPESYVAAVRRKIAQLRPAGSEGKPVTYAAFYYFSPAYESVVISNLDYLPENQP